MLPEIRSEKLSVRKMRNPIKTLTRLVAVFCVVASPAGAMAFNVVVFPDVHDFGDVAVGGASTTIVTVTNMGDAPVEFTAELLGDASFMLGSDIPSFINPGQTIDIQITFNPSDQGFFTSDLPVAGTGGTSFGGMGVPSEPPVEPTIEDILDFFDTSAANGTLVGSGPGNSANGRRGALRNQIEAAGDLISDGYMEEACDQLMNAYLRCDGLTRPPDFVAGPAAPTLAGMILDLIDSLAGVVTQDLVSEDDQEVGKALLWYDENMDETDIRQNCWDLEPGTEYVVLLCECDDDGEVISYIELGSFTTNETGNANLHARVDGDKADWCVVVGSEGADGLVTPCGAVPGVNWDKLKEAVLPGIVIYDSGSGVKL